MAELRIARSAEADLRNIRAYSKSVFGADIARLYLKGFAERFALLRAHATIGAGESDLGDGMRSIGYRSHRIYYAVRAEEVVIIRILHHAQDVTAVLGRDRR